MNITNLIHSVSSDIISTRYILILSYHLHTSLSNGFFDFSNPSPHFPNFDPKLIEIIALRHLVVINYEPDLYVFFPHPFFTSSFSGFLLQDTFSKTYHLQLKHETAEITGEM